MLSATLLGSCNTLGSSQYGYKNSYNKLLRNIELFNSDFTSKSTTTAHLLVKDEHREEFLKKLEDIRNKVVFEQSTLLNIRYFSDGRPIRQNYMVPDESFDEAVVTHQYQVVISPSTKLQTLLVQQRWELAKPANPVTNDDWVVIPNVNALLYPEKN